MTGSSGLAPRPARRSQEPQRSRRHSRDASCLCPLWQFWIGQYAATACSTEAALAGLGPKTTRLLFRSREHAPLSVTYPTLPAADNMTGAACFQALGAFSVQLTNVFREKWWSGGRRHRLPALALALLLSATAEGEERQSLTIGI